MQITCRAGESLGLGMLALRPLPVGDTLAVQAASDEGIVLRLHVHVWQSDDGEAAKRAAVKRTSCPSASATK